ncbi:DASH complex subunit Dad3-domain-containing protein [Aspergillus granulosus]|uniref:DASH complex subunit DAD3 n=1 Tax=Aspergillus granulosus TaxID=176169 RepID=A0ABR4I1N5_9EURO
MSDRRSRSKRVKIFPTDPLRITNSNTTSALDKPPTVTQISRLLLWKQIIMAETTPTPSRSTTPPSEPPNPTSASTAVNPLLRPSHPFVSDLEQEVLDEYARLLGNVNKLSTKLADLAESPSSMTLDGLRQLERKTATVCTLLKASVYSIVLQQQMINEGEEAAQQQQQEETRTVPAGEEGYDVGDVSYQY